MILKRLVAGAVVAGILTVASSLPASPIRAGNAGASKLAAPSRAPSPSDIVATARQYLGSPYAWIGNTPAGFSCIGFVNFVFHQNGVYVPFDIPMAYGSAPKVAESDLMPGDVLFFSNTVFAGLSHVAIYIGGDQMIGADSFAVGVTTDQLHDGYWQEHYTGATRPLALLGTAPMPGTEQAVTPTEPTPTPVPTAQPVLASATAGSHVQPLSNAVGMYSGPGYQYSAVATISTNADLTVVQAQGSWYDVHQGTLYGWVSAGDVRMVSDSTQGTATSPSTGFSRAAAISPAGTPSVLYVAQGPLYVRSGPVKAKNTIGYVLKGDRLSVIGVQANWAHVKTPSGQVGWVDMQYLSSAAPANLTQASTKTTPAGPAQVKVTASVLNVRAKPDTHAKVLTVL
ncbi:MAG: SH3 domain-containing protein, partial [Chloroflexota bacterium]